MFSDRLGIRSLINLQLPGEHAHCGTLEQSGFTYDPNTFMTNDGKPHCRWHDSEMT